MKVRRHGSPSPPGTFSLDTGPGLLIVKSTIGELEGARSRPGKGREVREAGALSLEGPKARGSGV